MATSNATSIQLPKPIMIGAGILILLGLFLASGDPGKKEREQLRVALTEAQAKISALEVVQTEQQAQLKSQQENSQLLLRRIEVSEENNARLRARIDEVERQLIAQRKSAISATTKASTAKASNKTSSTKPSTTTKPAPIKK
jgi:septal ring factor EnvC (AmiA/AmiB activator)